MQANYRGVDQIKTVAVVGTGVIGAGWAACFLAQGLTVRAADPAPGAADSVRAHIKTTWSALEQLGLAPGARQDAISFHADPEDAAMGADFIQENAPEREDIKRDLYRRLDHAAPSDVLIASSSSSFAITDLQQGCTHPERCVLGHPFNPVHLIPLVEVCGGKHTDHAATLSARAFYCHIGKRPVLLNREIFGHIANRLASAMFREAVHLVSDGITTVQGIDDTLRFGPALKWAIQGQFMTYHTSGGAGGMASFLDKFGPGQQARWKVLGDPTLSPEVRERIVKQMEDSTAGRSEMEIARDQDTKLLELVKFLTA